MRHRFTRQSLVRFALLVGALLVLTAPTAHAQTVSPTDSFMWDHPDADLTSAGVVRFEICTDAVVPCLSVTPAAAKFTPTAAQGGPPAAGFSAYRLALPALVTGSHTSTIKACGVAVCGGLGTLVGGIAGPLTFSLVIVPGLPTNFRTGK